VNGFDADAASYASDFDSYHSDHSEQELPLGSRQHVAARVAMPEPLTAWGPSNALEMSVRSDMTASSAQDVHEVTDVGLDANDWLNLLAEAESLINSPRSISKELEVKKVRQALVAILGSFSQVDQALGFVRERRPLGETVEADELLLQTELADILGDENMHALPLLERCIALEG